MNTDQVLQRIKPCLKLLVNGFIDRDIARELIDTLDMETVLSLQVVLLIGMEGMEQLDFSPAENPTELFTSLYKLIPLEWDDPEAEKAYLLQPDYKKYLEWGMHILGLDNKE